MVGNQDKSVLIIDDHELFRTGIKLLLKKIPGITIIGEANNGWLGIRLARRLNPDLVILDFKLPDISGIEVTQRLIKNHPAVKILVLTAQKSSLVYSYLFTAGVHGYLEKSITFEELAEQLALIFEGPANKPVFDENQTSGSSFAILSSREIEVMQMMIRGDTPEMIASHLHIEVKSVYSYRSDLLKKLAVKNVVELTLLAIQEGVFSTEDLI